MQPRVRATLVVAAIAVASAIAGAAVDRTFLVHPRRHGARAMGSDSLAARAALRAEMLDRLDKDVSLTPAQRVAALLEPEGHHRHTGLAWLVAAVALIGVAAIAWAPHDTERIFELLRTH